MIIVIPTDARWNSTVDVTCISLMINGKHFYISLGIFILSFNKVSSHFKTRIFVFTNSWMDLNIFVHIRLFFCHRPLFGLADYFLAIEASRSMSSLLWLLLFVESKNHAKSRRLSLHPVLGVYSIHSRFRFFCQWFTLSWVVYMALDKVRFSSFCTTNWRDCHFLVVSSWCLCQKLMGWICLVSLVSSPFCLTVLCVYIYTKTLIVY